jgi:hypothetical protein
VNQDGVKAIKSAEFCFDNDVLPSEMLAMMYQDELNYDLVSNPDAKDYIKVIIFTQKTFNPFISLGKTHNNQLNL